MDHGARGAPAGRLLTGIDFETARASVARHARLTPILPAPDLTARLGREVLLKAECLQHTGSFKVRGAAARLEALDPDERARGVVACSSGNHGRAVAFVAGRMGVPATVYVPEWVDAVKLAGIRESGAHAVLEGRTFDESEAAAVAHAHAEGHTYVSAYDDPWVIAGQGTLALEILDQCGELSVFDVPAFVVAPLSGGGLIGGVAAAMSERLGDRAPTAVAVSAENAAVMLASIQAGHPVELPEQETLANALAGGIGPDNRHSFALVRDHVREHAVVTEAQIADAMRYAVERLHLVVEGGGAVGLAAVTSGAWAPAVEATGRGGDGPIVIVLSGGNVSSETLVQVLAAGLSAEGASSDASR